MQVDQRCASDLFSFVFLAVFFFFSGTCNGDGSGNSSLSGPIFLKEPANKIDFSNTTGTVIECAATGNPHPEILWMKTDGSFVTDVPGLRQVQTSGSLVFAPFRPENYKQEVHAQSYRCIAQNPAGSIVSRVVHVRAVVNQTYQVDVKEEHVILGNSALLKCIINPSFATDFVFVTSWTILNEEKVLTELNTYSSDGNYMVLPSGELHIRSVTMEDGYNSYRCWTKHRLTGETVFSTTAGRIVVIAFPVPLSASIEPRIQTVEYGSLATLTCNKQGNPIRSIEWMRNGVKLNHSDTVFRIEQVRSEDKGMYQCFVLNEQESAQASAELKLGVYPPQVLTTFIEQAIQPGLTITLKCSASGNPLPEMIWEFDGKKITSSQRVKVGHFRVDSQEIVSYLNITDVQTNDGGLYKCSAFNKIGRADHSARFNVYGLPYIRPIDNLVIMAGETLFVTCPVAGYPIDSIRWKKSGSFLPANDHQKVFPNGTLIIENVRQSVDQGSYTCVAKNTQGVTARGHLKVQVTFPPHWIVEPTNKVFDSGVDAKIECKVKGFPKPQISWKKASKNTPNFYQDIRTNNYVRIEDGILLISNIQKSSEGYYLCEVTNGIGVGLSAAISVSVQALPKFEIKFKNQTVRRGDPAVLQCEAKGEKPMVILWTMNNRQLDSESDPRYTVRETSSPTGVLSTLSITKLTDSALFTCVATNTFGNDNTSINVIVLATFDVKVLDKSSRSVILSWSYDDKSSLIRYLIEYKISSGDWKGNVNRVLVEQNKSVAQVSNLFPATRYHFRLVAEKDSGSSEPDRSEMVSVTTAEEAPSNPPQNVKVEAINENTLKVSWNPPTKEYLNEMVLGYYVGYKQGTTDKFRPFTFEVVENKHELNITHLKENTQYSVVVQVFNRVGAGPLSDEVIQNTSSRKVTKQSIEVLDSHHLQVQVAPYPPIITLVSTTTSSITINVKPLKNETKLILGYNVHYKIEFGDWEEIQIGKTLQNYTLNNLPCGTRYQLYVKAYNAIGTSEKSDTINISTEGLKPTIPDASDFLEISTHSVTLKLKAWSNESCPIFYFVVEYRKKRGEDWTLVSNSVKYGGHFVLLDLNPGTWYNLRVTAHNNAGFVVAEYEFVTLTL